MLIGKIHGFLLKHKNPIPGEEAAPGEQGAPTCRDVKLAKAAEFHC